MATVIAIIGATGNQGGAVARSLLQNPTFSVWVITRNADSEASKALALGQAQIIQADGFNQAEMAAALRGATGLYVNINSDSEAWRDPTGPTEFDLGKKIVDAAAEAGVQHLVYSSGPPCTEMTGGKISMKAMDMKYRTEQYARQSGKFRAVVPVNPAWYFENFLGREAAPVFGGFPYVPDSDGFLTFRVPNWGGDNKVPFLSITEDYGDIVHGIFLNPEQWDGRVVHAASALLGFDELVADFQAVTGRQSRFEPILPSWENFDTNNIPELEDVKLMFGFTQTTGGLYFGPEPSQTKDAAQLKRAAAAAAAAVTDQRQGQQRQSSLLTAKEFFQANFSQN